MSLPDVLFLLLLLFSFGSGQIVTIETVGVPILNGRIDGGMTTWKECADDDSPYVFALRVFYNREVNGRIYGTERAQIGRHPFFKSAIVTYKGS